MPAIAPLSAPRAVESSESCKRKGRYLNGRLYVELQVDMKQRHVALRVERHILACIFPNLCNLNHAYTNKRGQPL